MAILTVTDIEKRYGELKAVDGVSFAVEAGEIYGLLGPNGAGKTTTISVISGLLRANAGTVEVDGQPFWKDPVRAKGRMGVVPQEIALYEELTGRENLLFWGRLAGLGKGAARRRADELLEALSLDSRGGDLVKAYSGGMKRRINMGCALMHRPKLLLLDEPTVGIDPQARNNILDFVEQLAADGTAVLYTTHYLEEAERFCNRIGIIDHGQVLAEGTLAELQQLAGGKQLYTLEGELDGARERLPTEFHQRFRILQSSETQLTVASIEDRNPADCLRELLDLPVRFGNISLKNPTLNEVFLNLTGRDLRE
ncbi:MAG: ATP-binding cassette domain-containing protein [Verrucomicrobia bacterium]|jgi:ABC-2 type transport system ATP-binding protein|nr:ATP-binding cassette domain-containing protein [Verrucomicrobiota bacterium]